MSADPGQSATACRACGPHLVRRGRGGRTATRPELRAIGECAVAQADQSSALLVDGGVPGVVPAVSVVEPAGADVVVEDPKTGALAMRASPSLALPDTSGPLVGKMRS